MKNTKSSVVIKDLAPLATEGIQDLSPLEINKISGGMTFQFSYNSDNGESYTFINDDGEITEKGTRPDNFITDFSESDFTPVVFTPVFFSPVFFSPLVGFRPVADDENMSDT